MITLAPKKPKPFKAFRDNYLAVVMMVAAFFICSVSSAQTDSAKYSRINGYGFMYKRWGGDSIVMIPLSTSPHTPYRPGGVRYNPGDSALQVWTGHQWNSIKTGGDGIDTAYAFDDSTIAIVTTDETFLVSLRGQNLSNASLVANGDYAQDWAQHWFLLNNLKALDLNSNRIDPNHPGNKKVFQFYSDSTADVYPLFLKWALRNVNDNQDSLGGDLTFNKNSLQLNNYDGNAYATIYASGNQFFPSVQIFASDGSIQSALTVGANTIFLDSHDSTRVKLVAAATADSVVALRSLGFGLNTLLKVPMPSGGSGITLSNAGSGFRLVKTPSGQIKTSFAGYGIIKDSTTNTDGITDKADTSSTNHLVTQSDLNDAIGGVTSGINQLTGDVTTGPGTGSQIATIASNAVTSAKFRQSVGNSLVGRSASSTGNVADIQASTNNTYITYDGSIVKWDSIDYAHLKNKPDLQNPGVYFSPGQAFDPSFVVFSSCIPYASNSFSHGSAIVYQLLDHTSGHNSSFYDSAYGNAGNGRIVLRYPTVKNVLNSKILCDETLSGYGIHMGPTVGESTFEAPAYQTRSAGMRLVGDGAGNWTKISDFGLSSSWDVTTFNTADGGTSFNVDAPIRNIGYDEVSIVYSGSNNYGIKRVYSGLGSYNARFIIVDRTTGLALSTNPTTSDEVFVTNAGMQERQVDLATYLAGNNEMIALSNSNFWVDGEFECWLVAAPTSTTSTLVRWQTTYPSATNYKIYRSTSLYGSRTLIHTGADGSYTDSGLSSGTLYYYHMVAVVGGVDTYVTYFKTNTK